MRLILIGRWAGGPKSDWYPWLGSRLEGRAEVVVPKMPRPERAEISAWNAEISRVIGPERDLSGTVFVGHSVGCQAILRALALSEWEAPAAGFLGVGAWWSIDEPWESIRPWLVMDYPIDRARLALKTSQILLSNDDPYTRDYHANAERWRQHLGAEVWVEPGAGHFNAKAQPKVEALLEAWISAPQRQ
ncbi:MAG: alpha/beta hydrolase [Myxococcota bacterium]